MKVTRSSLLPTAMVLPSGDQVMLMFSPLVLMVVTALLDLASQTLDMMAIERRRGNNNVSCLSLPDCLVTTGRGQHVRLGGMPAQLVHTVAVTLEYVLLAQLV